MFVFVRCHRSSAAVTPVRYELDIIQVISVLIILKKWENNGTEKISLVTPDHFWLTVVAIVPVAYQIYQLKPGYLLCRLLVLWEFSVIKYYCVVTRFCFSRCAGQQLLVAVYDQVVVTNT